MSEKRRIDDEELTEITGAGPVGGSDELPPDTKPFEKASGSANQDPDTNAQGGDNQNLTD